MPPSSGRALIWRPLRCRGCSTVLRPVRTFASSSTLRVTIPPESPEFIEVPQPPQKQAVPKQRLKGILPIPRQVFKTGEDDPFKTFERVVLATPEPFGRNNKIRDGPDKARMEWKKRMAELRRQNLRQGLTELHERSRRATSIMSRRSQRRVALREALLSAPEREDERLTNTSITKAVRDAFQTTKASEASRKAEIAEKMGRVTKKEARRLEERRDALHTLYMNAKDFITNETQLKEVIEKTFGQQDVQQTGVNVWGTNPATRMASIWGLGRPATIQELLAREARSTGSAAQDSEGYSHITKRRVKRIAEELTGGKMADAHR